MNVLIVENDPNLRALCNTVFADGGYVVTAAGSTVEAEVALRRTDFDMMVLDLYVGRDSGLALVALAERISPEMRIVILSGQAEGDSAAMEPCRRRVLHKPVDVEDLLEIAGHDRRMSMPGRQGRASLRQTS